MPGKIISGILKDLMPIDGMLTAWSCREALLELVVAAWFLSMVFVGALLVLFFYLSIFFKMLYGIHVYEL